MAKKVFLIRPAKAEFNPAGYDRWQFPSELTAPAKSQIKKAVEYFGNHGIMFSDMWYSPLTRARRTCVLMAKAMGFTSFLPGTKENLGPGEVNEWCRLFREWLNRQPNPGNALLGLDGSEYLALWPELCRREGERVFEAVVEIAKELVDGKAAAAFSHNPLIRLAQYAATGRSCVVSDIGHCQAIAFVFNHGRFTGCEEHLF